VKYGWERPISTQQTGFSFVSQARSWLPDAVGGVIWYGVDDTYYTCYVPLYCGINDIPESYEVDITPLTIGDAIRVKDLSADKLEFTDHKSRVVVMVASARGAAEDEEEEGEEGEEGAEGAEGEEGAKEEK
jgi:hypothetical protein